MLDKIKQYLSKESLDILKFSELVDIRGVKIKSAGFGRKGEYWDVYYNRKFIGKTYVSLI